MTSSPTRSASGIAGATRYVLPNGMVALIQRNPHSPTVSVRGEISVGSVHEPAEKSGLASFNEKLGDRVDRHVRDTADRPHGRSLAQHGEDLGALGEMIAWAADALEAEGIATSIEWAGEDLKGRE